MGYEPNSALSRQMIEAFTADPVGSSLFTSAAVAAAVLVIWTVYRAISS